MANGILTRNSFLCGSTTLAAGATAQALVSKNSDDTFTMDGKSMVRSISWIRIFRGATGNSAAVSFGSKTTQNGILDVSDEAGYVLHLDDPSKIWISGTQNDIVQWQAFE